MTNCIFCKIADKSLPASLLYENEDVVAFRDLHPQTPDHILIIPIKHMDSLNHASVEDSLLLGKLLYTAKTIAQDLGHKDKGYRLVMNTGDNGGQTVSHIHLHLLAGKPMSWPPG